MSIATMRSVHVGRVAPLGPQNAPSGFIMSPTAGIVAVHELGLAGDEQADHSGGRTGPARNCNAMARVSGKRWTAYDGPITSLESEA